MYLGLKSTLSTLPNTTVYWENNLACFGGAMIVSMLLMRALQVIVLQLLHAYIPQKKCFFQLPGQNLFNGIDVNFVFKNNFAGGAGSVLYMVVQ